MNSRRVPKSVIFPSVTCFSSLEKRVCVCCRWWSSPAARCCTGTPWVQPFLLLDPKAPRAAPDVPLENLALHPVSRLCLVTPGGDNKESGRLGPGLDQDGLPAGSDASWAALFAVGGREGPGEGSRQSPPTSIPPAHHTVSGSQCIPSIEILSLCVLILEKSLRQAKPWL